MDDDRFFLRVMRDLRERCQVGSDSYDVQGTTMILRLLLLDRPTEVTKVNARRGVSVRYRVRDYTGTPYLQEPLWSAGGDLDPDLGLSPFDAGAVMGNVSVRPYLGEDVAARMPPEIDRSVPVPIRSVNHDQLLQHVVMASYGRTFTVADLIDYVGYVKGPLHRDKKGHGQAAKKQRLTRQALQRVDMPGVRVGLVDAGGAFAFDVYTLRAIGQVVYRGLFPLKARIDADLGLPPSRS